MKSIRKLYKIGNGPSSSHTMGPKRAAQLFLNRHPSPPSNIRITLYGSLAATGKGHLTDEVILSVFEHIDCVDMVWKPDEVLPHHPNGMIFESIAEGNVIDSWTVYSVGGGSLYGDGLDNDEGEDIYPLTSITEIMEWCDREGRSFWEYVEQCEGRDIWEYMAEVWRVMCAAIDRGLQEEGVLPGGLRVSRKAANFLIKSRGYADAMATRGKLYAYALATSEENAAGNEIVTAPTCGSCGVLPAVMYHLKVSREFMDIRIYRALATAGLFGNIVKTNASISGADVGCQGEVGVACSMAAAAACQLFGGSPSQVEYAAEMALEHHLGLTCDPVCGLVQIPCIERNAIAAARAFDANIYATFSDGKHRVSFDKVVAVMSETGHDIPSLYKETSTGGLAKYKLES